MYIRKKHAENSRIKRPSKKIKNYDNIFSSKYGVYIKIAIMWSMFFLIDFLMDFRIETFWSCWLMCRSVNDIYRYQGMIFTLIFIFIVVMSDVICFLLIPTKWLFFLGCTYVWIQLIGMADRSISAFTVGSCVFYVYIEFTFRLRQVSRNLSVTLNVCRPFAAHCIGYPVVMLCFELKNYVSHKFRIKRQSEVKRINQFYYELVEKALPEDLRHFSYTNTGSANARDANNNTETNAGRLPIQNTSEFTDTVNPVVTSSISNSKSDTKHQKAANGRVKSNKWVLQSDMIVPNINQIAGVIDDNDDLSVKQSTNSSTNSLNISNKAASSNNAVASQNSVIYSSTISNSKKKVQNNDPNISSCTSTNVSITNNNNSNEKSICTNVVPMSNESTTSAVTSSINTKVEQQIRKLRNDLASLRKNEAEFRTQIQQSQQMEASLQTDSQNLKTELTSLQSRLKTMRQKLSTERQNNQELEKKLAEEKKQSGLVQNQLDSERRSRLEDEDVRNKAIQAAIDAAARSADCCDLCRSKRREMEVELSNLRRDVRQKEDRFNHLLQQVSECSNYQKINEEHREMSMRISCLKDENLHLTEQLRELNKMKQELLTSYHSSQLEIKELDVILKKKNYQIQELQHKLQQQQQHRTASTQNHPQYLTQQPSQLMYSQQYNQSLHTNQYPSTNTNSHGQQHNRCTPSPLMMLQNNATTASLTNNNNSYPQHHPYHHYQQHHYATTLINTNTVSQSNSTTTPPLQHTNSGLLLNCNNSNKNGGEISSNNSLCNDSSNQVHNNSTLTNSSPTSSLLNENNSGIYKSSSVSTSNNNSFLFSFSQQFANNNISTDHSPNSTNNSADNNKNNN